MDEATKKLSAFFEPRSVAIVGATKRVAKAASESRCKPL